MYFLFNYLQKIHKVFNTQKMKNKFKNLFKMIKHGFYILIKILLIKKKSVYDLNDNEINSMKRIIAIDSTWK